MKKQITLQEIFETMQNQYTGLCSSIDMLTFELKKLTQISTNDIPNTEYVTITADDVLVGGEPTCQYHGEDLYNYYHLTAYFKEARDIIRDEYGYELLEMHCLQSSTDGEYAKTGNPVADKDGTNCWVRVVYLDKNKQKQVSLWAFSRSSSSDAFCASNCAYYCGNYVQSNASLRAGLFGKNDN